ncbi:MAG: hypothetical protein KDD11_13395, partial [Acidobacteria bacterium]|nr:hypothetical protein [Acidobacteriota bacterium]
MRRTRGLALVAWLFLLLCGVQLGGADRRVVVVPKGDGYDLLPVPTQGPTEPPSPPTSGPRLSISHPQMPSAVYDFGTTDASRPTPSVDVTVTNVGDEPVLDLSAGVSGLSFGAGNSTCGGEPNTLCVTDVSDGLSRRVTFYGLEPQESRVLRFTQFSAEAGDSALTIGFTGGVEPQPLTFRVEVTPPAIGIVPAPSSGGGATFVAASPLESLRGFRPNEPFLTGQGVESINTANGNLVLSIPLGQVYQVGPTLSYQFRVTHNSDVWQTTRFPCRDTSNPGLCATWVGNASLSVPNPNSNAGLGWELHFGKLYQPRAPDGLRWPEVDTWPNSESDPIDLDGTWLYVSPDGASHTFHALAGWPDVANGARYTKDGSYLRLVSPPIDPGNPGGPVDETLREIHHPNGVISRFEKTDEFAGTGVCGRRDGRPGPRGCWRFREMVDPSGNYIRVDYAQVSASQEIWTLTDRTGRRHTVRFRLDLAKGDALGNQFRNTEGDELGDLRRVVEDVDLAAFGGRRAVYSFDYSDPVTPVLRGCPNNVDENGTAAFDLSNDLIGVPILKSIQPPEGQPWVFETSQPTLGDCRAGAIGGHANVTSGRITAMVAPGQGKVRYTYGNWSFPTPCNFREQPDETTIELATQRLGVIAKSIFPVTADPLHDPGAIPESTTTYSSSLELLPETVEDPSGPNCTRFDHRRTQVDGPAWTDGGVQRFERTNYYSNLYFGPAHPPEPGTPGLSIDQPLVTDYGLPFQKGRTVGTGPGNRRFLSEETLECVVGGSCTPQRELYVRYETGFRDCPRVAGVTVADAGCYPVNPVRAAERTVFKDDGGNYIERQYLDADGAGNIQRAITRSTIAGTPTRDERTNYTRTDPPSGDRKFPADAQTGYIDWGSPATYLPTSGQPWILGSYDRKEIRESSDNPNPNLPPITTQFTTDFRFDSKGLLTCSRRLVHPEFRGANDLETELVRDAATGLVSKEIQYGGDGGALSASLCVGPPAAARVAGKNVLETRHEYQHLTLSRSYVAGFPNAYHAIIDLNSGQPQKVFGPTEQGITLDFDRLGRVVSMTPDASLQEARAAASYDNPPNDLPHVRTQLIAPSSSVVLSESEEWRDHAGRIVRQESRIPTTETTDTVSAVERRFNPAGFLTSETTLQAGTSVNQAWATRFSDFDVFGRPRTIRRPDNSLETQSFSGVRLSNRTVSVQTSETGATPFTYTSFKDGLGRERRSVNPLYEELRTYDPNGNVTEAKRRSLDGALEQVRTYTWDARGFLLGERLPELGPSGSADGTTTYTRNVLGSPLSYFDGLHSLVYDYDAAGRPLREKEASGRIWQEWEWSPYNCGSASGCAAGTSDP